MEHVDAIPRVIHLDIESRPHLVMWTDASWENDSGVVGVIIYDMECERFYYSWASIPDWLVQMWVPKMQQIGQAELAAAIFPYISLPPSMIKGRRVLHFIDNFGALCAIFKGYSKAPDSAWMINLFHAANTKIRARIWWEHVDSKANCTAICHHD